VYAFVGPLPAYCIDTVHQTRLFFDGPIYFIINDMGSSFIPTLRDKYNVTIIPYSDVEDKSFYKDIVNPYRHKFVIVPGLKGREGLFIHSFERFFLLNNLMKLHTLSNVFFMELDNLIYDSPLIWLDSFRTKQMSYMFDNYDRSSSGIAYIKNTHILKKFLEYCNEYILHSNEFLTEMTALYRFWEKNKEDVQILPTHWLDTKYPSQTYESFSLYNNTIFDALSIGIYITGIDPCHTNGVLKTGIKNPFALIDYTVYKYKWELDSQNRNIPYILNGNDWLQVNNLHVHSKNLKPYLSK
jgi:hypothetical protein